MVPEKKKLTKKQRQAAKTARKANTVEASSEEGILRVQGENRQKEMKIEAAGTVAVIAVTLLGLTFFGWLVGVPAIEALAGKETVADIDIVVTVAFGLGEAGAFGAWLRAKNGQLDDNRAELERLRTRETALEEQVTWLREQIGGAKP